MDNIQKRYGYTGQGLRVNLTTGKITKEPTFPRFKDEIGELLWATVFSGTKFLRRLSRLMKPTSS